MSLRPEESVAATAKAVHGTLARHDGGDSFPLAASEEQSSSTSYGTSVRRDASHAIGICFGCGAVAGSAVRRTSWSTGVTQRFMRRSSSLAVITR